MVARSTGRALPCFYEPIDLNHPDIAAQGGLTPTERDPRFHQQMTYAVAMRTLEAFDKALGRIIRPIGGYLRLFPHALRGDNAFYDPDLGAVLFGYFDASRTNPGPNLPGQTVKPDIARRSVNWGYAISDAAIRSYMKTIKLDEPTLPFNHEGI